MKKIIKTLLLIFIFVILSLNVYADDKLPQINCNDFCVMDMNTKRVIYGNNINNKVYPASTTKIITAMVAYDELSKDVPITITSVVNETPEGSSISGYKVGDSMKINDIIRGLMMPSGNDIGILLADTVSKRKLNDKSLTYDQSQKYFADLMNKKAKIYGAENTHFSNPHGFYDENHYTTPYDMAIIASHIKEYPELEKIVKETKHTVEANNETGLVKHEYKLYSHNEFLIDPNVSSQYATGIKTGYTNESGYCLVASAKKGKQELVITLFGCKSGYERSLYAKEICEYVFNNTSNYNIIHQDKPIKNINIFNGSKLTNSRLSIITKDNFYYPLMKFETKKINYKFEFLPIIKQVNDGYNVIDNIHAQDRIGKVNIYIDNYKIGELPVFAKNKIIKAGFINESIYYLFNLNIFYTILFFSIIIVTIITILFIRRNRKKTRY